MGLDVSCYESDDDHGNSQNQRHYTCGTRSLRKRDVSCRTRMVEGYDPDDQDDDSCGKIECIHEITHPYGGRI